MTKGKNQENAGKAAEAKGREALEKLVALDPSEAIKSWLEACQGFSPVPSVDLVGLFESHQKNRDVWMTAMKRMGEMAEGVALRQREIFENSMQESAEAMSTLSNGAAPAEKLASQADYVKRTLNKALEDATELGDFVGGEQKQILELLIQRMDEFIGEIKE